MKKLWAILHDIKIQHTILALPFALMSAFLAAGGMPPVDKVGWILLAMLGARSAAMAFNRIVDAPIDAKNQRTRARALPSGFVGKGEYFIFLAASIGIFVFACVRLNPLCLLLSPVALTVVFFYSFTKRFTWLSHFFLGLALSLAPIGAWAAVANNIGWTPIMVGLAVLFWLAGLDIIYACQDYQFDRENGLFSFPQKFGLARALKFSGLFHTGMVLFLLILPFMQPLGAIYLAGVAATAALLWYEHSIVSPDDLRRVNAAFFNLNGAISVLLMFFVMIDIIYNQHF
jgi:4-hydroxybenzoate polyprenyltransferase